MGKLIMKLGYVVDVEDVFSKDNADGLRIKFTPEPPDDEYDVDKLDWCFPLMPKAFQSIPKIGECVLIVYDETDNERTQKYYLGPVVSQPQFHEFSSFNDGMTLLKGGKNKPLKSLSNFSQTNGSFPKNEDVAMIGRGKEDVILRYDEKGTSEVDIRAGIRYKDENNPEKALKYNVIFNDVDPAYIQLKYSPGIATGEKNQANSVINVVADRINIMSNKDSNVSDHIHDRDELVKEEKMDDVMNKLHQVPKGDKLVELLELMKGALLHHVHPWAGMEQCGDWSGYIKKLEGYNINSVLSDYVRIS